jgi:hypothetical protein
MMFHLIKMLMAILIRDVIYFSSIWLDVALKKLAIMTKGVIFLVQFD